MAKTALITGASSGIGREIARNLYGRGFRCILCARREERLNELAEELGGNTRVIMADLSRKDECFRLYNEVRDEKISILINGAGFGNFGKFIESDLEKELDMIDTNIISVHILTKLFLRDFAAADRGYIMNIASSAGLMSGGPYMSTYYASKAYVTDLTSAVAEEIKQDGKNVHICALCPGPVDTEFNDVAGCSFGVNSISARYCSDVAIKGMFEGKTIIVPESGMKVLTTASRFIPRNMLVNMTGKIQSKKAK